MLKSIKVFSLLLICLICGRTVFAQKIISGKITDPRGEPLPAVNIQIKGTTIGTISDVDGNYRLSAQEGNVLVFRSVGFVPQENTVGQVNVLNITMKEEEFKLDEVLIVGSRNQSRTKVETPVPVDIIPISGLLQNTAQMDMNGLLTNIAPSFQSNRQTIADGTDHTDPASLRGLGPDQILVLINGKRQHTSSLINVNGTVGRGSVGTDMNSIPAAAIERIEILRDGASAQYGSDAIAGVINIVLKKNTDKFTAFTTEGIHKAGDGALVQFNSNYGFKLGEKGYINVTGDVTKRGYTNRADDYSGPIFSASGVGDEAELAKRGITRHDLTMRVGNSAITNGATFFNASLPIAPDAELYSFGGLNYRRGESAGFYRLPFQTDRVIPEIYPNGFLPEILSSITDKTLGIGLRGKINGWNVDFSNTYGMNSFMFTISNSLNASLLSASPSTFKAGGFRFGQNTTNFDVNRFFNKVLAGLNVAFGGEFRVDNYEIVAGEEKSWKNYGLRDIIQTVDVKDATGKILYTYQKVTGQYDELQKAGGSQVFPGFSPDNALNKYRLNLSAYLDLEADFTKNFTMDGAVRYENYSDFGSTFNGKLASLLNLSNKYAIRGAISTGFRAPSLQQQYFNTVNTRFLGDKPVEVGTFHNDSRVAKVLGIPKLKQETSMNMSFGLTARPTEKLTFTADFYSILIDDRIVLTGLFSGDASAAPGSQDRQIFDLLLSANANRAQFFTNAISTSTSGLDLVATYKINVWKGQMDISLASNLNKTKVGDKIITSELLKGKESVYFSREQRGINELGTPKSKINLTMNYRIGKYSAMLKAVRFGTITYLHPDDGNPANFVLNTFTGKKESRDQTFSAKIITDLTISRQFGKNIMITAGSSNLLDVYPDRQKHSDNYSFGRFPYSRVLTQFGFNGAFYFMRMGISF